MIKLVSAKIHLQEWELMDDIIYSTQIRMLEYSKKHPDFSCVIEKDVEEHFIIVKTLKLEENAN